MRLRIACLAVVAALGSAVPASAAHHLIKIVEVFGGTTVSPNAQYVVLQMYAGGQTFVSGESITVFDVAGAPIGTFTFTGNVANGANQAKILVATTQATTFFGVTANLTMSPILPVGGGKICYGGIGQPTDCVAWGNYYGSIVGVGPPFNGYGCQTTGLVSGKAMIRRLDRSGSSTDLDSGDDTDYCAVDFINGSPAPRNNASQLGLPPSSTCGNAVVEGLEECDGGAGCSATCRLVCTTTDVSPGDVLGARLATSPNPFQTEVAVLLSLPEARDADVGVYDLSGRRLRWLHRGPLGAGPSRLVWDGRDELGGDAGAGLYFVHLRSGDLLMRTTVVRSR